MTPLHIQDDDDELDAYFNHEEYVQIHVTDRDLGAPQTCSIFLDRGKLKQLIERLNMWLGEDEDDQ